jgi:DUF1365 family protein
MNRFIRKFIVSFGTDNWFPWQDDDNERMRDGQFFIAEATMAPTTMGILLAVVAIVVTLLGLSLLTFFLLPLTLAKITLMRRRHATRKNKKSISSSWKDFRSALYTGTVWHTRHLPVKHAFTYPLFLFCLDLQEVENESLFEETLWPLSKIVSFRPADHLKNGEGRQQKSEAATSTKTAVDNESTILQDDSLQARICRLLATKTNNKFQPTPESHRIVLVTHLSYYGYCFNPVSFYYVQERRTKQRSAAETASSGNIDSQLKSPFLLPTSAVVAEVSNTPWNEMYCYVLHPDSVDVQSVAPLPKADDGSDDTTTTSIGSATTMNYIFPKTFHVSPFMEMHYMYDWKFSPLDLGDDNDDGDDDIATTTTSTIDKKTTSAPLRITTGMKNASDKTQFSATMNVHRSSINPSAIAWQICTYPVYCLIIQLWIHYEAFWLFVKGVSYQPHPDETETTASLVIGTLMTPFFAVMAWMEKQQGGEGAAKQGKQS